MVNIKLLTIPELETGKHIEVPDALGDFFLYYNYRLYVRERIVFEPKRPINEPLQALD